MRPDNAETICHPCHYREAMQLRHICEVCGTEEILTAEAAYHTGWDYPPRIRVLGVIGPRTCSNCAVNRVWWAITVEGATAESGHRANPRGANQHRRALK